VQVVGSFPGAVIEFGFDDTFGGTSQSMVHSGGEAEGGQWGDDGGVDAHGFGALADGVVVAVPSTAH